MVVEEVTEGGHEATQPPDLTAGVDEADPAPRYSAEGEHSPKRSRECTPRSFSSSGSLPLPPGPAQQLCFLLQEPADIFQLGEHAICVISCLGQDPTPRSRSTSPKRRSNDSPKRSGVRPLRRVLSRQITDGSLPSVAHTASSEGSPTRQLSRRSLCLPQLLLFSGTLLRREAELSAQLSPQGIAMSCRKGRTGVANQDSILFIRMDQMIVFGIADGSGPVGQWASHWVAQSVLALLMRDGFRGKAYKTVPDEYEAARIFNILQDALLQQAEAVKKDLSNSGCSLSLCFVDCESREVVVAWLGASMILCVPGDGQEVDVLTQATAETRTSTATLSSTGPQRHVVTNQSLHRPGGILPEVMVSNPSVSRGLGMLVSRGYGGHHVPCVTRYSLSKSENQFLLCGSLGLWDAIDIQDAVSCITAAGRQNPDKGVDELYDYVDSQWGDDEDTEDASVIVMWI